MIFSQSTGNLNIFSDSPERFYVYLNGALQNAESKTNVGIENLNQRYYNVRITFENKNLKDITKKYVSVVGKDGITFEETTYKIKIDSKNKKTKLNYFSSKPIKPEYIPAPEIYIIREEPSNPNVIVNNGINININNSQGSRENHNRSREIKCPELNSKDFDDALNAIKKESFDDQKLSIAQNVILKNCLRTDQIALIAKTFAFSQNQMQFVKNAYSSCIDVNHYYLIKETFKFESDKKEFITFINSSN